METTKFKTNIKCTGCVATVAPFLDAAVGESKWEVDLTDPSKILTVNAETNKDVVIGALEKAGYKAEKV
jgi:copper chaperone CopZ